MHPSPAWLVFRGEGKVKSTQRMLVTWERTLSPDSVHYATISHGQCLSYQFSLSHPSLPCSLTQPKDRNSSEWVQTIWTILLYLLLTISPKWNYYSSYMTLCFPLPFWSSHIYHSYPSANLGQEWTEKAQELGTVVDQKQPLSSDLQHKGC